MSRRKKPKYVEKLASLAGTIPPGLSIAHIYHDDGCAIWKTGICDCDPDIVHETPSKDTLPAKIKKLMDDNAKIGKG